MKKFIASLTAFICASAMFVGCGKTDDDDEKSSGKKSGKSTEEELEDLVNDLIDAGKDMDIEKIAELGLPDDVADTLFSMASDELKKEAEGELTDEIDGKLISVKKTKDIDESYLKLIEKGGSAVMIVTDYMKENGIDIEDLETMDESYLYDLISDESLKGTPMGDLIDILQSADSYDSIYEFAASGDIDKIESRFTVTEGCMAEVTMESDGETETMELPFYKIEGEGWNGDIILYPAMIGYVKKSKQSAINSVANSMSKAADVALTEMDEQGYDLSGTYIVSNNDSWNYNLPSDIDASELIEEAKYYFDDIDDFNFFVVVVNGSCEYVACENSENPEYTGTYPVKSYPSSYDGSYFESSPINTDQEKLTFQELYDMAVELIDNPTASDDE